MKTIQHFTQWLGRIAGAIGSYADTLFRGDSCDPFYLPGPEPGWDLVKKELEALAKHPSYYDATGVKSALKKLRTEADPKRAPVPPARSHAPRKEIIRMPLRGRLDIFRSKEGDPGRYLYILEESTYDPETGNLSYNYIFRNSAKKNIIPEARVCLGWDPVAGKAIYAPGFFLSKVTGHPAAKNNQAVTRIIYTITDTQGDRRTFTALQPGLYGIMEALQFLTSLGEYRSWKDHDRMQEVFKDQGLSTAMLETWLRAELGKVWSGKN